MQKNGKQNIFYLPMLYSAARFVIMRPASGDNGAIKNLVGFPSGQREQTVNLPSQTSKVRILPPPPFIRLRDRA